MWNQYIYQVLSGTNPYCMVGKLALLLLSSIPFYEHTMIYFSIMLMEFGMLQTLGYYELVFYQHSCINLSSIYAFHFLEYC